MVRNQTPGFAGRLRELREKAGYTQQQLGERAGMHMLTVAKLEQGLREPSWGTVLALAHALGVSCEVFAQAENNPAAGEHPKRGRGRPAKRAELEKAGRVAKRLPGRPRKEK